MLVWKKGEVKTSGNHLSPVVTTDTVLGQSELSSAEWYLDESYEDTTPEDKGGVDQDTELRRRPKVDRTLSLTHKAIFDIYCPPLSKFL